VAALDPHAPDAVPARQPRLRSLPLAGLCGLGPSLLPAGSHAASPPAPIVMHGDALDWIENLPDPLPADHGVPSRAPSLTNSHDLGEDGSPRRRSHARPQLRTYLQAPTAGGRWVWRRCSRPPHRCPPATISPPQLRAERPLQHLSSAWKQTARANQEYQMNLRVMFIGHTHAAVSPSARPTAASSLRSWTAGPGSSGVPGPGRTGLHGSERQIAAMSHNEIRIYQLGKRPETFRVPNHRRNLDAPWRVHPS